MTLSQIFYGPGDWVAESTTARQRRAAATWIVLFWLGPGFILWLFLLHSILYIGVMSLVAIWLSGLTLAGTETPVEAQN